VLKAPYTGPDDSASGGTQLVRTPRTTSLDPQSTDGAFRSEAFGAYFRGLRIGTQALVACMQLLR